MARKPKPAASLNRKNLECIGTGDPAEDARRYAAVVAAPDSSAARVLVSVSPAGIAAGLDVPSLAAVLREQAKAANAGDLKHAEAMLTNQAVALEGVFAALTERAMAASQLPQFEAYMRLALRAQNQARATIESLATMRNPPIVYARQANVTTGPQQVNNGTAAPSRARDVETEQSQLLEATNGQRLDTGTTGAASAGNQEMEAVGTFNGATDG